MAFVRSESVQNGPFLVRVNYYACDGCEGEIFEGHPHMKFKGNQEHYCCNCSFIREMISEKEYLSCVGLGASSARAAVRNVEIVTWFGKRPPWEQTNKDIRSSTRYKKWRTQVFERDKYTCRHCNQVGGELNAHHIKAFAKYKKLRFEVSNGLTLCVPCHRKVHKKR